MTLTDFFSFARSAHSASVAGKKLPTTRHQRDATPIGESKAPARPLHIAAYMFRRSRAFGVPVWGLALLLAGCIGRIGSDAPRPSEPQGADPGPPPLDNPSPDTPPDPDTPDDTVPRLDAVLGAPDPARCGPTLARIWKLTPGQINRSLARLTSTDLPIEAVLGPTVADSGAQFSSQAAAQTMSTPHFEALVDVADLVADTVVPQSFAACAAEEISATCRRTLIARVGEQAFRRPLTSDEIDAFDAFMATEQAAGDDATAFQQLMRAIVLSPGFLYRTELGPSESTPGTQVQLTSYEIASSLSYLLTDGPPDDPLLAAAGRRFTRIAARKIDARTTPDGEVERCAGPQPILR